MGPIGAIRTGFAKSFQFSGRATRSAFWWFAPGYAALLTAGFFFEIIPNLMSAALPSLRHLGVAPLFFLWLLLLTPTFAAFTRRLSDIGFSAAWVLVVPLYLLGAIPLAVAVDASPTWGIPHPARGAPELFWMFEGLIFLMSIGLLISLFPSQRHKILRPNPNEVPQ